MQRTSDVEFSGELARQLGRNFLGEVELVGLESGDSSMPVTERGRQRVRSYLTVHEPTRLGVVTIALPACSVSPHHLLNQMTMEDLRVTPTGDTTTCGVTDWLARHGLRTLGKPRAAIVLAQQPKPDCLRLLLAAEVDPVGDITSREVRADADTDIAQYNYYRMYVSETCEVEVPTPFRETYELRVPDATLTLFIMEVVLLQEAALSRVHQRVAQEISRHHYEASDDSLAIIEDLGREFADAMLLWDIRNFRYRTAQNLADHFARAFRVDKLRENYNASRQLLEQLIEIHSARLAQRENRVVNALLIMLTTLQVLPVIYLAILGMFRRSIRLDELLTGLLSVGLCAILWLVFLSRRNRQVAQRALRSILHPQHGK